MHDWHEALAFVAVAAPKSVVIGHGRDEEMGTDGDGHEPAAPPYARRPHDR